MAAGGDKQQSYLTQDYAVPLTMRQQLERGVTPLRPQH